MSPDEIVFSPSAERELKKLDKTNQDLVFSTLQDWQEGNKEIKLEKLKGYPKFYRMKAGRDLRVIFHPITTSRIVILVIRDRKSAYRGLNSLHRKLETYLQIVEQEAIGALANTR